MITTTTVQCFDSALSCHSAAVFITAERWRIYQLRHSLHLLIYLRTGLFSPGYAKIHRDTIPVAKIFYRDIPVAKNSHRDIPVAKISHRDIMVPKFPARMCFGDKIVGNG